MKGLREAGHECILLGRENAPLWRAAVESDFLVHDMKLWTVRKQSDHADVVHVHDARSHTVAALAVKREFVVSRRVAFPVSRTRISRWKYGRAARFLAVSQCAAEQLLAAGVPSEKVEVVFDGVEPVAQAAEWKTDYPAVVARVLRARDDVPSREMEDERVRLDELRHELLVRNRALDELGRRRDRLGVAHEQAIEDGHLRAGVHEPLDDRAANEPGPAGHEVRRPPKERSGTIIA